MYAQNYINHFGTKIFIADKQLFLVILLNSIRKHSESCKINNSITEISESNIITILNCLNVEKIHTALLLRTLSYILRRKKYISPFLGEKILYVMKKVALSPLSKFKQYAYDISQIVIPFLNENTKELLCNIDMIPIQGIDTCDLVKLYSEDFMKHNQANLVKKICCLFGKNVDNKDGKCLYERLIIFYPFEKWKADIWPLFLPYLQGIDDTGYVSK